MNLVETLLALLAGLACTAALALCAHDLRARTQALQEAEEALYRPFPHA